MSLWPELSEPIRTLEMQDLELDYFLQHIQE